MLFSDDTLGLVAKHLVQESGSIPRSPWLASSNVDPPFPQGRERAITQYSQWCHILDRIFVPQVGAWHKKETPTSHLHLARI